MKPRPAPSVTGVPAPDAVRIDPGVSVRSAEAPVISARMVFAVIDGSVMPLNEITDTAPPGAKISVPELLIKLPVAASVTAVPEPDAVRLDPAASVRSADAPVA